jgi:hypothetical protein
MPYEVAFVDDDQLPAGSDWVIVRTHGGRRRYFFVKRSKVCPELLAEAWRIWEEATTNEDYSIASSSPAASNA